MELLIDERNSGVCDDLLLLLFLSCCVYELCPMEAKSEAKELFRELLLSLLTARRGNESANAV